MKEPQKQTFLDTNPKDAQPIAKMPQSKIRTYWIYVIIAVILGLIAAAELVWWLSNR